MTIIRAWQPADAEALAAVFERAVRGIAARDYSPNQIAAWIGDEPRAGYFRTIMSDGRRCWVALDGDGRVSAFADLEADGHIDYLFADPDVAGQGVASDLLDVLERTARDNGMARLYVEASEAARRRLLKRGYRVEHRRDFELRGVAFHNYAMELWL